MKPFVQQCKDAHMSFAEIEMLTDVSLAKLKNHSSGVKDLSPEDLKLVNGILAAGRLRWLRLRSAGFLDQLRPEYASQVLDLLDSVWQNGGTWRDLSDGVAEIGRKAQAERA